MMFRLCTTHMFHQVRINFQKKNPKSRNLKTIVLRKTLMLTRLVHVKLYWTARVRASPPPQDNSPGAQKNWTKNNKFFFYKKSKRMGRTTQAVVIIQARFDLVYILFYFLVVNIRPGFDVLTYEMEYQLDAPRCQALVWCPPSHSEARPCCSCRRYRSWCWSELREEDGVAKTQSA
jgi:hypothetical protein